MSEKIIMYISDSKKSGECPTYFFALVFASRLNPLSSPFSSRRSIFLSFCRICLRVQFLKPSPENFLSSSPLSIDSPLSLTSL